MLFTVALLLLASDVGCRCHLLFDLVGNACVAFDCCCHLPRVGALSGCPSVTRHFADNVDSCLGLFAEVYFFVSALPFPLLTVCFANLHRSENPRRLFVDDLLASSVQLAFEAILPSVEAYIGIMLLLFCRACDAIVYSEYSSALLRCSLCYSQPNWY